MLKASFFFEKMGEIFPLEIMEMIIEGACAVRTIHTLAEVCKVWREIVNRWHKKRLVERYKTFIAHGSNHKKLLSRFISYLSYRPVKSLRICMRTSRAFLSKKFIKESGADITKIYYRNGYIIVKDRYDKAIDYGTGRIHIRKHGKWCDDYDYDIGGLSYPELEELIRKFRAFYHSHYHLDLEKPIFRLIAGMT